MLKWGTERSRNNMADHFVLLVKSTGYVRLQRWKSHVFRAEDYSKYVLLDSGGMPQLFPCRLVQRSDAHSRFDLRSISLLSFQNHVREQVGTELRYLAATI